MVDVKSLQLHPHPSPFRVTLSTIYVCIQAKHKDRPLRITMKRATQPFELTHSDVCEPYKHPTLGVYRYYTIFMCDYTRWTEIFLPGTKPECCSSAFVTLEELIKVRNFKTMKFRCDNGKGEYNKLFRSMLASRGVTYEPCPPYTHHKNGCLSYIYYPATCGPKGHGSGSAAA